MNVTFHTALNSDIGLGWAHSARFVHRLSVNSHQQQQQQHKNNIDAIADRRYRSPYEWVPLLCRWGCYWCDQFYDEIFYMTKIKPFIVSLTELFRSRIDGFDQQTLQELLSIRNAEISQLEMLRLHCAESNRKNKIRFTIMYFLADQYKVKNINFSLYLRIQFNLLNFQWK